MSYRYFVRKNLLKGRPARFYRVTEHSVEIWSNECWEESSSNPLHPGRMLYVEFAREDLPDFDGSVDISAFRYFQATTGRLYRVRSGHGTCAAAEYLLGGEWTHSMIYMTLGHLQGDPMFKEIYEV